MRYAKGSPSDSHESRVCAATVRASIGGGAGDLDETDNSGTTSP
jgi:hypothetical protein